MSFLSGTMPAKVSDWMRARYEPRPTYQSPTTAPSPTDLIDQVDPLRSSSSPAVMLEPSTSNYFSDRLKVFIGTWNMFGRLIPFDLSTFLTENVKHNETENGGTTESLWLDGSTAHPYHLLVIGTQECEKVIHEALFSPSKEVWEKQLSEFLGSDYKLVKTETLAALHIAVFVWVPVASLVREVQSESVKTGWGNMIGNKGAVAVSVLFGTRSLLFINCHLTAHQTKLSERNANVQRILYDLKMPEFIKSGQNKKKPYKSVIDQFDHVFFFGDTNYRVTADRSFVFDTLRQGDYNTLLEYDQLSIERRTEESPLYHFREHPIQFPPTYKLDTLPFNNDKDIADTSETEIDESSATTLNHHQESLLSVTNSSISNGISRFTSKQSLRSASKQTATNIKRKISKKFISASSSIPINNSATVVPEEENEEKDFSPNQIVITSAKSKSPSFSSPSSPSSPTSSSSTCLRSSSTSSSSSSSSSSTSVLSASLERSLSSPSTELSPSSATIPPPFPPPLSSSSTATISPLTVAPTDKSDSQITIIDTVLTYDTSDKQRIPSWTDRILWCDRSAMHHIAPPPTLPLNSNTKKKTINKKSKLKVQRPSLLFPFRSKRHIIRDTVCYSYNAVLDKSLVGVSDHLPVIGVYGIWYDEWHLVHMDSEPLLNNQCKKIKWWQNIWRRAHCR